MITDRNKLNFVTIQWLWFLCLILATFNGCNTWIHYAEATQHQQQQQQLKSTLQLQPEVKSNGPLQPKQQDVTVRNFSPRMDYNNNEWRPVGRGDPLKNDPTFDYSPPTLDRVKYWADSEKDKDKPEDVSAALIDVKLKKANPGKNEILLLGVTGDRMREDGQFQQHAPSILKNAKGETPLLQPKYTSIRRSYYAHQLPTHLMPPPMQPMIPASQQHQMQTSNGLQSQQQQSQHPKVQAMHIVKPAHTEYRHNMPGHSFMTSSPVSSMSMHSSPYYMSTATQPWMHASSPPSMRTSSLSSSHSPSMMSVNSHRYSHPHSHAIDSHHQESLNYLSYNNRPSLASTPSIMLGMNYNEIYSPNSIRGLSSGQKLSSTSSRKPWIHDLLQKEFIKPAKTTKNPNSYNVETIKSTHLEQQHFEPIARPQGISTTYAPVTFVTPTSPSITTTTQKIYITSTTQKQATSTSLSPMYSSTLPTHTTHAPQTTTTLSPTRLLIPNTSNLSNRPTVASLKMTTDSLFSHYNQPEEPLKGPMYLIIEGHSKVKTYGKDELDPHKPKIVPIIPKREPVVRMADPNEKRGTPETFQVKHLHTKPIATTKNPGKTTTRPPKTSTTTTVAKKATELMMKTTPKTTTTVKPKTTVKTSTTVKPILKKLITTINTSTTTTAEPITTKTLSKISTTMIATKPQLEKTPNMEIKSASTSDLKMSAKISSPNALKSSNKPVHQDLVNEPPTAMQGLLSFLDSSLGSIFKEHPNEDTTTKLQPIQMKSTNPQQQLEARISTKLEPIKSEDYQDYENDNYFKITTEYIPRETRQVFDYDQLPESRISLKGDANYGDFLEQIDDEDDLSAFNLDDEYEDEDEVTGQDQNVATINSSYNNDSLIKRIDSLVGSSIEDDEFGDISSLVDDDLTDIAEENLTNLARNHQRRNEAKKA